MYDEEAVAAVNAAGLHVAFGKNIETVDGHLYGSRTSGASPPLFCNQKGEGPVFWGQYLGTTKISVDKDGNISPVGTVDGVKISGLKIVSIPPAAFVPTTDTQDWLIDGGKVRNNAVLDLQRFYAPAIFPNGVTVSKLTLYGFRNDPLATMVLELRRAGRVGSHTLMAQCTADWTDEYGSIYDDTITDPVIDNANYSYLLELSLHPNDAAQDVWLTGAVIELA